jgi:hypothetical protein
MQGTHGRRNRIFSSQKESNSLERLSKISSSLASFSIVLRFAGLHFNSLLLKAWILRHLCAQLFIHAFRKLHRFSSRRFHIRPRQRVQGRFDINEWIEQMKELLFEVDNDRIINYDEAAWKVMPSDSLAWVHVFTHFVAAEARLHEKGAITVLASVTASRKKLRLDLIAKDLTS